MVHDGRKAESLEHANSTKLGQRFSAEGANITCQGCTCFTVEQHLFSARTIAERKLWLRLSPQPRERTNVDGNPRGSTEVMLHNVHVMLQCCNLMGLWPHCQGIVEHQGETAEFWLQTAGLPSVETFTQLGTPSTRPDEHWVACLLPLEMAVSIYDRKELNVL